MLRYAAVATAALGIMLAGCPQRQEILEQTVRAMAETAAARIESSHVPDELLTWELVAEIEPGFDQATAVAFGDDDALYVGGDEAVRKFSDQGLVEWEMPVAGQPTAVAVVEGMTWVAMQQQLHLYAADGSVALEIVPEGERTWITSFAVGPEAIYLADAGSRRYWVYDRQGWLLGEAAAMDHDRDIPALSVPSPHLDIFIGAEGELWLTNPGRRSVQVHSPEDGALLSSFGRSGTDIGGFSGCCNPTDIALLPGGRVVTSEKGLPRVKVYSPDGELLSVVEAPNDFLPLTAGIGVATDSWGRIAVLDPERGVVRLYAEMIEEQVSE